MKKLTYIKGREVAGITITGHIEGENVKQGKFSNLFKIGGLLIAGMTLAGCGTAPRQAAIEVANEGASAADAALEASEWGTCTAATVGAVRRKYGKSEADMQRWRDFCGGGDNALP